MTTVAELRDRVRELLDVPEYAAGSNQLRSRTLSKAAEAIGVEGIWGGGPSKRQQIRQQLAKLTSEDDLVGHHTDAGALRKDELENLVAVLEEGSS